MAREQFGPYMLLKRLGQDPLGETFRAGRVSDASLEQVTLLRVLNGSAVRVPDLPQRLQGRAELQSLLRSPNLAHGLDLGDHRGVPYVAYDYISGRDLASLMVQAQHRSHPVPVEHALLIAERTGLGLAMAYGSRLGTTPIVHGFLVPELIMVSNEGEIRLLGFEFSQAMRQTVTSQGVADEFRRYLSPEVLAGAAPSSADDVYSLGIILLELLTGTPMIDHSAEALNAAIQRVAGQGLPSIATLVQRSLAPAGDRIDSTVTWHQLANQLLEDGNTSSTPFHLAFYMHNLFRDEIALESAEIERERSIDFSKTDLAQSAAGAAAATAATAATAAGEREPSPVLSDISSELPTGSIPLDADESREPTPAPSPAAPPEVTEQTAPPPMAAAGHEESSGSGGKTFALAALALLVIVLGAAGAWWMMNRNGGDATGEAAALEPETTGAMDPVASAAGGEAAGDLVDGATADAEAEATAAEEAEAKQEELLQQLDQMVAQRTQAVESNLRSEYDEEIQRLRTQLEDEQNARAAEEAKIAAEEERQRLAEEAAVKKAEEDRLAQQRAAAEKKKQEEQAAAAAAAATAAGSSTPAKPAATEEVRLGQLIETAGPGVVSPQIKQRPDPQYPYAAKRLRREADVTVHVLVDENGQVIDYRLDKKAGYGFDEAAVQAARQATFKPATKNGVRVKMWTSIKMAFRN